MAGSNIFDILARTGYSLITFMTDFFTIWVNPISDLIPPEALELLSAVPILDTFLAYTLLDILAGAGLLVFVGYTLVKWLIP